MVDLSAATPYLKPTDTSTTQAPEMSEDSNDTVDFVGLFVNALNNSFDSAEEAATKPQKESEKAQKESASAEASQDSDVGILQISLPAQPPVVNIDLQPVLITETSSWSPTRTLWLIMAMCLLAVTVSAFMFFVLKRSRNRRGKKQQFQPTVMAPVYTQTVPTVTSEVKIPIS